MAKATGKILKAYSSIPKIKVSVRIFALVLLMNVANPENLLPLLIVSEGCKEQLLCVRDELSCCGLLFSCTIEKYISFISLLLLSWISSFF